ncbi:CRP/FNR family transcriptional regulator, anaerobic regulatory protein [Lentibacillus persicus]|uniref:CRP/FNR family transcriptional regulator, anaerobic regulatory protein n=1 Tax=Lentibacillus persicus TaxID=640948 RepID=A0A1I1X153_9BACI|nr:Crp/Fnr family transcriptional regulator [Lentibacillus persicus]SFE01062.1 CRP/FNR family transcriptional regulator, anaerobic regulatory protein [Lentibacillus persicus]
MEPILERLSTKDQKSLIAKSKMLHIPKNAIIFENGAPADYLYFIHKGNVRIFKQIEPNKELTIFTRGEQDGFGEIGVFGAQKYSNSAKTLQDSMVYAIERSDLEEALSEDGRLSLHFTRWLAESLEGSKAKIRDYIAFGSEGAVASIFIRYSNMHGVVTPEGVRITEPIMIQDISKHIAVSRETVSRIVNKWKDQGIITNENKYFLIKDMEYFRKLLVCEQCNVDNCVL